MTFKNKSITNVFLFAFLLQWATNAYSQQENGIVSLQKQASKTVLKDYYIAEFIDARDEKDVIGIKTSKKHDYYWRFSQNAQEELAVCLGNSSVISTKKAVTLRLNRLWLSKTVIDDFEKAIAVLSFTFLEKQADGSYLELATISKKAEKNYGGGKEDGFYAQAIAAAVEQILQNFNTQSKQQIKVAADKIAENPLSNLGNLPIFNTPPRTPR